MKKKNPNEPELRVLSDGQKPVRLGDTEAVPHQISENVELLKPDADAKLRAKAYEPDVADILETEVESIDAEAAWGEGAEKAPPMGWFVLAGMVLLGLALWAAMSVFKAQPDLDESVEEKKELTVDLVKEAKDVRLTLDRMRQCVHGYLTAKNVAEKLRYVRHPARVKPLMEAYYQSHEMKPEDFRKFERIRSMGLESLSFVYGQVELLEGGKHQLLLEQLEDGGFRVDWESDVCYLPVEWEKYTKGETTQPVVMRVFLKRDNFYAYEFSDESRYACYILRTRDSDEHLFAFVEKGSVAAMDINRFMKRVEDHGSQKPEPLMLRLRFPENTRSKRCVLIDAMIAPRWTYVKSPGKTE